MIDQLPVIGKWSGETYKRRIKAVAVIAIECKDPNDKI